jgi:hypothetical protein
MVNKVPLNFDNAKVKVEERTKGRMKIIFKLAKEEAEAFKNFTIIKPDNISDEVFYKHIFFTGIRTLNEELKQMFEANKAQLEAQKTVETNLATITPEGTENGEPIRVS